ncbi:MAG: hypothetical protein AB7E09_05975 [Candidatus Izemoplasmatales bacterium]
MIIIKWILRKFWYFITAMSCNIIERWNIVLATLIPIIIYGILKFMSGSGVIHVRVVDFYVISMSVLLTPVFDLFYRFFNVDVENMTLKKFRGFIKKNKLITSIVLIILIVMLMAFDKSNGVFETTSSNLNWLYSSVSILLLVASFYLLDLYDEKGVHKVIKESAQSEKYQINNRGNDRGYVDEN